MIIYRGEEYGEKILQRLQLWEAYHKSKDKIFDECYNKNNKEFNFVAMLDSDEQELKKICKGDIMMEEIENEIRGLNKDEEFTEFLSREEDVRKLTNTLLHHSKDDGIKEKTLEAANNLLSMGMEIKEVFNVLNVENEKTKDEIKEIAKKVKKDKSFISTEDKVRIETAKNLLKMKMSINDISKATGLSKNDIKKIKE
ncbi:MAG: hypothetical protein IKF91_00220 [Bacilli bacterium]|nr:hypothetical protein [Bacilli bacterium]